MSRTPYPRIATLRTPATFRSHLERHGIPLAFDDELAAAGATPLARPLEIEGVRVGNRFCILPMEGWDGTREGAPSELTRRRWRPATIRFSIGAFQAAFASCKTTSSSGWRTTSSRRLGSRAMPAFSSSTSDRKSVV